MCTVVLLCQHQCRSKVVILLFKGIHLTYDISFEIIVHASHIINSDFPLMDM